MNNEEFVSVIKQVVRESAIEGTLKQTEKPSGRKVSDERRLKSEWYNHLSEEDKKMVRAIITDAVDDSVFGFFAVLDGVRAIENDQNKGELFLIHKKNKEIRLNDPNKIYLHDLYNTLESDD